MNSENMIVRDVNRIRLILEVEEKYCIEDDSFLSQIYLTVLELLTNEFDRSRT